MSTRTLIPIHMACNDPDNGNFAGRVCQISLQDEALSLTANAWNLLTTRDCPKLREDGQTFILSGKRWPFVRSRWWVGNWCWDAYVMEAQAATDFLVWLHGRGLFHCEGGWAELAEAWHHPAPLVLPDRWWVA